MQVNRPIRDRMRSDNYDRPGGWTYRVLSQMWICPDEGQPGQRLLTICRVHWRYRPQRYPLPGDISAIEIDLEWPIGQTTDELTADLGRMQRALDEPALIQAEWTAEIDAAS
jgi:hypothetical protein